MTDTSNPPAVVETSGETTPFNPEFIVALRTQATHTLWPIFDEEATNSAREKEIKECLAKGNSSAFAELSAKQIRFEKFRERDLVAVETSFDNINPQDAVEGMLTAQITAVHNAVMEYMHMSRVAREHQQTRGDNIQTATKLIRAFVSLTEALDRHRGKSDSQQTITVQHVHINDGAQAVIGNVSP